jgi:SAM-dependent methyltransferase
MRQPLLEYVVSLLRLEQRRSYAVLDIGCGDGAFLHAVAQQIAPGSRLVGTDAKAGKIENTNTQHATIEFIHHKFTQTLPFPDNAFDLVASKDVLECIVDKGALLREMARVLKPKGTVLCAHWDWDTQVYASDDAATIRKVVHAFADWQQGWMDTCDGQMGRKLWGLFQGSGLFDGRVEVYTYIDTSYQPGQYGYDRLHDLEEQPGSSLVASGDLLRVQQEMAALDRAGAYFYSLNSYIYIGQMISG